MKFSQEQLARWRLILGKDSQESMAEMSAEGCGLSAEQMEMDEALEAIYASDSDQEIRRDEWETSTKGRPHGAVKGRSMPRVARWLDQIRNFFPKDVVVLLQQDAIERRGMKELLFEPEIMAKVEPSVDLASAVLELKNLVPEKAKDAASESLVAAAMRPLTPTEQATLKKAKLQKDHQVQMKSLSVVERILAMRETTQGPADERKEVLQTVIKELKQHFNTY